MRGMSDALTINVRRGTMVSTTTANLWWRDCKRGIIKKKEMPQVDGIDGLLIVYLS